MWKNMNDRQWSNIALTPLVVASSILSHLLTVSMLLSCLNISAPRYPHLTRLSLATWAIFFFFSVVFCVFFLYPCLALCNMRRATRVTVRGKSLDIYVFFCVFLKPIESSNTTHLIYLLAFLSTLFMWCFSLRIYWSYFSALKTIK